jgi:mannose-6-phosphate isomerase-like protein (cupin superfamily)
VNGEIVLSRKGEIDDAGITVAKSIKRPATTHTMEGRQATASRAYKRLPGLSNSTWYKGTLIIQMAGTADNNGAFDLAIAKIRRGTEPPPHVHSREDEFFYVLSGELRSYVDERVIQVRAGECIFFPRRVPHAWLISSEEVHVMVLATPGGFLEALNQMNAPAERMEIPNDASTYADLALTETMKVFYQYGIRLLTEGEIRTEMPEYPL